MFFFENESNPIHDDRFNEYRILWIWKILLKIDKIWNFWEFSGLWSKVDITWQEVHTFHPIFVHFRY